MKIVKYIFKALFGLHLWLPIAYSVVFVAVAAIAGLLAVSWQYYFIGLSLSLFASLGLVYASARRVRNKAAQPRPEPRETRKPISPRPARDYELTEDAAARIADEQMRYTQAMKATPSGISGATYAPPQESAHGADVFMRPETMQQYYGGAVRPETTEQSAHDALYPSFSSSPTAEETPTSTFSPYVQPANIASAQSPKLSDLDSNRDKRGKPEIYRTRKEPNVLIYEYPDCIEKYYVNADGSLTYLSTKTK